MKNKNNRVNLKLKDLLVYLCNKKSIFNKKINNHRASSCALFLYYHIQYHPHQWKSILISISPNSYHYSIALPPFSTISLHFYPSTSSIVENVEKPVENLLKILNYIQILSNYYSNIQEISRKLPLDILCTQIIIRLDDLTHIFSLNLVSTSILV